MSFLARLFSRKPGPEPQPEVPRDLEVERRAADAEFSRAHKELIDYLTTHPDNTVFYGRSIRVPVGEMNRDARGAQLGRTRELARLHRNSIYAEWAAAKMKENHGKQAA